jgi:hypothetical protein
MGAWHDKIAVYTQADVAEIIGQHLTGFKHSSKITVFQQPLAKSVPK